MLTRPRRFRHAPRPAIIALLLFGLAAQGSGPVKAAAFRVVGCDAIVQSQKRGVCANHLNAADFSALAPGVSWWYNWFYETKDSPPAGVPMRFTPMVWGDRAGDLAGLKRYLAAGHRPARILAINEPNLRGQAFISPARAAALYAKVKSIGDKYHIPVTGPQMAIGSAPADSITAVDPIENKNITYTFMLPYLKAFQAYVGAGVGSVAIHTYGNMGEMRWAVDLMRKEFGKPIWVTEYAHAPNAEEALTYLMQSTDCLERSPDVQGYAWFKERGVPASSLLANGPGKLTALGVAYVHMPVHDDKLYYRLPGRLPAEKYASMEKMEIWPTKDQEGFADMQANEPGAWIDYNVYAAHVGVYALQVRTGGDPGAVTILAGGRPLATAESMGTKDEWRTLRMTVKLAAGAQTIRIQLGAGGQKIHWLAAAPAARG